MADGIGKPVLARSLIGREAELAALQDAWCEGGTAWVVISAAGVGKSRLGRELASWVRDNGGVAMSGRCSPTGKDTPLRPWREALLAAARSGRRPAVGLAAFVPALARLVPEWGGAADDASALVLGEAVLRLLSSWATPGAGVLVVLEDLHWADVESLAVLEYVIDNLAGAPMTVVATLRDREPGAGSEVAAGILARRAAHHMTLDPLTDDEVLGVARSCLDGGDLPDDAAATLVARSEGVPFLIEELLATAVRSGWHTISDGVPGSVAASVVTRLGGLPPRARMMLIAAALLGRQFDWTLAARAAAVPEDEAVEHLRLADHAQLVDSGGSGYRFRHALTRDAVVAGAVPSERLALAARAVDALEHADPHLDGEHCPLAAQLAFAAGQHQRAAELWIRAADRALDDGALGSAESLARQARDAATGEGTREDAEMILLRAVALQGHTARARALGGVLLAGSTDDRIRADVHLVLGAVDVAAGRWDDAEEHAGAARVLAGRRPATVTRVDILGAQAAMGRVEPDVAVVLARAAIEGARATTQPTVECEALEIIGRAERGRDLGAAEAAFQAAHDLAARSGLRVWQARAMQELGTIDMFGSLSADRMLEARRLAADAGALALAALVDLQLAALYEERGEVARALEAAWRCEEPSRRWQLSTLPMSLAVQAFAHAQTGDRTAAEAAIGAALATGEDRLSIESRAAGNVRALLHILEGDLGAAVRAMNAAMDVIRANPGATHTFPGMWALLRTILDDDGDAARAEVAALAVDTPVSRVAWRAAEAVAAGRAGHAADAEALMDSVAAGLSSPGGAYRLAFTRHLVAPAADVDAWGDPIAWLRESLATFEASEHDALAARCRTLLRDLGAPVPRRGRGDIGPVPTALAGIGITSREADVLTLVAQGATNREVAERLFISPRTVDKHVERLLQKTGSTRAGLADLARKAGLVEQA